LPQTGQQAIPRLLIERGRSLDLKSDCFSLPLLTDVRFHLGRIVLIVYKIVNIKLVAVSVGLCGGILAVNEKSAPVSKGGSEFCHD
jgi:hypothetical protein